jgi:hypothetical protein
MRVCACYKTKKCVSCSNFCLTKCRCIPRCATLNRHGVPAVHPVIAGAQARVLPNLDASVLGKKGDEESRDVGG